MRYQLRKLWHRFFPLPKFRDYCDSCWGMGGAGGSFDPSPSGVSLGSGCFYNWDPCEDCANEGICPSCSAQLSEQDANAMFGHGRACPFCGATQEDFDTRARDYDPMDEPDPGPDGYEPFYDEVVA